MIESTDAANVVYTIAQNLIGVSKNKSSFQKLPDTFWGYYARGHDQKGKFGIIITYSESGDDVDNLIQMYDEWVKKNKNQENK